MSKRKPKPMISPAMQPKIAPCHSPELERALEVAFRKLQAEERIREEEQRDAIRQAGSSPLVGVEPLAF